MTRRAIDIDDETWRRIKVEAAERGLTVKEVVANRLRSPVILPPHMDVAGFCQRDGQPWPCLFAQEPDFAEVRG